MTRQEERGVTRIMSREKNHDGDITSSHVTGPALTLFAGDGRAAVSGFFLHCAALGQRHHIRTDLQEAHEHVVPTGAVQARLVSDDLVTVVVVLHHVEAACEVKRWHVMLRTLKGH